ncbi:MAG: HAD family hydrolase [Clostridiales bacterium]|nr:HAD family hydrolase [Clostridiales bacterium]
MALKAILFDLDGTLLSMDQDAFIRLYFQALCAHLAPRGYDPQGVINAVQTGIGAMVQNTGERKNEPVFWDAYRRQTGRDAQTDLPLFEEYYQNHFVQTRASCGVMPGATECIRHLKAQGFRLVLATNPIFPAAATLQRIQWAGLCPEDFEWITTYENSRFCKPNPDYYRQLAKDLQLQPEECLMAGNDALEDMIAQKTGMKVFLLTKGLLNKKNLDIHPYPQGDFDDLKRYITSLTE